MVLVESLGALRWSESEREREEGRGREGGRERERERERERGREHIASIGAMRLHYRWYSIMVLTI
jgi:hypothetical protein